MLAPFDFTIHTFTVSGKPMAKQRPRMTRGGHVYTPKQTESYEDRIRQMFIHQCRGGDWHAGPLFEKDVAVEMRITAYFPKPKRIKLEGDVPGVTVRPDWDNIGKIVSDALNGIAYHDDSQVCMAAVEKRYSDDPRIEVRLSRFCIVTVVERGAVVQTRKTKMARSTIPVPAWPHSLPGRPTA